MYIVILGSTVNNVPHVNKSDHRNSQHVNKASSRSVQSFEYVHTETRVSCPQQRNSHTSIFTVRLWLLHSQRR
jgi:hypothetical protein